ncbi:MAG: glycosyltransferase family 2 protein [Candidatus Saccharimonadales bacterium]
MAKQLISVVIPVYNEESNIVWFYDELKKQFDDLPKYDFEAIFVDDGSSDQSIKIIKELAGKSDGVRFLQFSRNFGKEAATSAGLGVCKGDAAMMIDVDGQHPVKLIPKFISQWEAGFEVVIGIRQSNSKEGAVKHYGSKLFYALLGSVAGTKTVPGSTDFRIIDRKVIDEFNKLTEHSRMTRGLIDWLGFKRTYIDFNAPARHSGDAAYSYSKLIRLALHGFVSQTTKPLQFTGLLGFIVTVGSFLLGLFLLFEQYIINDPLKLNVTGTAILALFLSFLVGLVLICQWLLALYIESIHNETQNRPLYIVSDKSTK